jgi:hypothetical protein
MLLGCRSALAGSPASRREHEASRALARGLRCGGVFYSPVAQGFLTGRRGWVDTVAVPIMACSEPIGGHGARACVRMSVALAWESHEGTGQHRRAGGSRRNRRE